MEGMKSAEKSAAMESIRPVGFDYAPAGSALKPGQQSIELPCHLPGISEMRSTSSRAHLQLDAWIACLQSQGVFDIATFVLGVSTGSEIERALSPDEYPPPRYGRWWERLKGSRLRIHRALNRRDPAANLWMGLLRQHSDRAEEFLQSAIWELLDPNYKELGKILAAQRSLEGKITTNLPMLCGASAEEAQRFNSELSHIVATQDVWASSAVILSCMHLARTTGNLAASLIAFNAWYKSVALQVSLSIPPAGSLLVFLGHHFSQVTLRFPANEEVQHALDLAGHADANARLVTADVRNDERESPWYKDLQE